MSSAITVSLGRLTAPQWSIFTAGPNFSRFAPGLRQYTRFRVVVAGRRFGKTTLALTELIGTATQVAKAECWYLAPSYRQAKRIAWKMLKEMIPKEALVKRPNESELTVEFKNGSVIRLMGGQSVDDIKGSALNACVLDEYGSMNPNIWSEAIRAALSDRGGWALFIGTPKGYNHFYDLWMSGKAQDNWRSWQYTTAQGGNVPADEIAAAELDMDERTFKQEYMASFESMTGRVYYAFDRSVNLDDTIIDNPFSTLLVGMDFNVNPMSACFSIRSDLECHTFAEIELANSNTFEMCEYIADNFGRRSLTAEEEKRVAEMATLLGEKQSVKRRIIIYPDPTGNSRKTSADIGQTDFSLLRKAGFEVYDPGMRYPVKDRINTVNAMFRSSSGRSRAFIHPSCKKLIKGLDGLTYKEETALPDKSAGLDHMTDGYGYKIMGAFKPISNRVSVEECLL